MIELNSKIKNALIKIGFIERYEELSNKFNAKEHLQVIVWLILIVKRSWRQFKI